MAEKTIYYSVKNCGDGSAYPYFFESQELADLDQEFMDEGWGETCSGSLTVTAIGANGTSAIKFSECITAEDVRDELESELEDDPDNEELKEHLEKVKELIEAKNNG